MRTLFAVALSLATFSTARAEEQEEYQIEPRALCTAEEAMWAYGASDTPAEARSVQIPDGAVTPAWECRVGRHTLTVRSAQDVRDPQGACGACDLGLVSVWVDRRQVAGEAIGEFDFVSARRGDRLMRSVRLRPDRLVVCYDVVQKFADVDNASTCETITFDAIARLPRDQDFVRVDRREPFGWALWDRSEGACSTLTPQLALPAAVRAADGEDVSFEAMRLSVDMRSGDVAGAPRTASFDLDNDGQEDDVVAALEMTAHGEPLTERWTWNSGGHQYRVPSFDRDHDGDSGLTTEDDHYVAYHYAPLRWRGRTLLYIRRVAFEWSDEALSAYLTLMNQPQVLSRGLIELSPDGSARLVCAWTPRSRVEDRL